MTNSAPAKPVKNKKSKKNIAGLEARQVALNFLGFILFNRLTFDEALIKVEAQKTWATLSDRDQAFVRNLVMTSVRHLTTIEFYIKQYMAKALPRNAYLSQYILIIGAAQLLYLETPPHAAISLSLNLAEQNDAKHYKKLINAILGKINREQDKLRFMALTAEQILPKWICSKWQNYYGEALTLQIAQSLTKQPDVHITVKSDLKGWAKKLDAEQIGDLSLKLNKRQPFTSLEGFEDGEYWAQDGAAAIAATLFDGVKGSEILDFCAAPGGKTMQLAAMGGKVKAVDINKNRLKRLAENLERTKLNAEIIQMDIRKYEPQTPPTHILLDAPCSATGTLRKHPEIVILKSMDDIKKLNAIQSELLNHSIDIAKSGAQIIYVVCSLEPEEGEKQIDALLSRRHDISIEPITDEKLGLIAKMGNLKISPKGWLRIFPDINDAIGGMDGFFIAKLIKS